MAWKTKIGFHAIICIIAEKAGHVKGGCRSSCRDIIWGDFWKGACVIIFNMLKSDVTEDEIVGAMKRDYEDAAEEKIRETVSEFVGKLKEADVLG